MVCFHLGPLNVYAYGLALTAAAALAWLLLGRTAAAEGLPRGTAARCMLWAVPLSALGARIAYCLFNLSWFLQEGVGFFFQWQRGGFVFYGALLGGLLALYAVSRLNSLSFGRLADAAAAPAALVIACGRLAEGLVGVGYGRNILDWFDPYQEQSMIAWEDPSPLFRFPFGAPDHYGDWNFAIFVPEALAAAVILVILLRVRPVKPGGRALLLVLLYAACQAILESMRQDSVQRWGFVRVSQLLSGVAVAAVLFICCRRLHRGFPAAWAGILLCMGVVMAMEFALEQKIGFLVWMRMDVCYLVMLLACLGMIFFTLPVWRRAFRPAEAAR